MRQRMSLKAGISLFVGGAFYLVNSLAVAESGAGKSPGATSPTVYLAPLQPINEAVNEKPVTGAAVFVVDGNQINAYVRARGVEPNMMHRQMIHVGGECPTAQADENGDKVVDVIEGIPSYGLVLVPLDDKLAQTAENEYPRAGGEDKLDYGSFAAFEELESNVTGPDKNPEDPIVKLEKGEKLDLAGKTVVIHGVSKDKGLPESVQGVAGVSPHLSVPVACGIIEELG